MSSNDQFNILGSSKLNTADGKNPHTSSSSTKESKGTATGQPSTADYKKECKSAHDAMEDRLREEDRLARAFKISIKPFRAHRLTDRRLEKGVND